MKYCFLAGLLMEVLDTKEQIYRYNPKPNSLMALIRVCDSFKWLLLKQTLDNSLPLHSEENSYSAMMAEAHFSLGFTLMSFIRVSLGPRTRQDTEWR